MIFFRAEIDYEALTRKIFDILHQFQNPCDLYPQLLKIALEVADAEGGSLVIREGEQYVVKECVGWESFAFRMEECFSFIYWLKRHQEIVTRQEILADSHFATIKKAGLNFFVQFQAEVCLPLFVNEGLFGFINLSPRRGKRPYPAAVIQALSWLRMQFALVLQNVSLKGQLNRQRLEIEEFKELKNQMLANLSHELRTPLTSVIGFAELLENQVDGPLNTEQNKQVRSVLDGANRLLKILTTLMDLARLESGSLSLNVQQFHLAPIVQSLVGELPLSHTTHLEVQLNGHTPRIYGDLSLVKQVFKHLLENAAKYTEQGNIAVSANKKGEMLEVCVADTGIGIEAEKLERIFEGFCQGDGGITRTFQGAGLGLAVTKKLVALHGGRLWVQSRPGHGSRFYFTLPLKPISIRHRELAA